MTNEPSSRKYELRYAILKWWYGGESGRQRVRKSTGVYKHSEGFEKPDNPKYHWTAKLFRVPVDFIAKNFTTILVGLIVGVSVLVVGQQWFR